MVVVRDICDRLLKLKGWSQDSCISEFGACQAETVMPFRAWPIFEAGGIGVSGGQGSSSDKEWQSKVKSRKILPVCNRLEQYSPGGDQMGR